VKVFYLPFFAAILPRNPNQMVLILKIDADFESQTKIIVEKTLLL